jgi:histone-lysine N-methyltransferase SETD2
MEGVTQENTEMILNEYQNENMYGSSEYFQQQEELQPEQHMQAQQQYIPQQPLMQQEQPEQHLGQIQNLPKQGQPMQQQFTDSVYSLSNLQVQSVPSGQQSDISFQSSQFGPSTGLQTQLMTMPVRQPLLPPPGPFQIQNIPPMPSDNMPAGNVQTPQSAVTFVPPPQQTSLQMAPQVRGMHMMSQNHLPVVPPLGGFMNNPFSVPPPMPVKSQSVSASVVGEVPNTVQRIRSGSNSPGEKSQSPPPPPLPPHWRAAKDAEGRTYYYHSKDRISQWEFPTEACARKETSDSLSEKNKKDEMKRDDKTATGPAATPVTSYEVTSTSDAQAGEKYDIKPDISLETWKMAQTELSTAAKKKELIQSEKDPVSKAKEAFRTKVSQVVVQCLNQHYRPDCSQSRIETADDFKHLARKLTYGIMEKHTRNSKHGVLPEFTGGTKSKVQEYVKTYMKKYGEVYTRN